MYLRKEKPEVLFFKPSISQTTGKQLSGIQIIRSWAVATFSVVFQMIVEQTV